MGSILMHWKLFMNKNFRFTQYSSPSRLTIGISLSVTTLTALNRSLAHSSGVAGMLTATATLFSRFSSTNSTTTGGSALAVGAIKSKQNTIVHWRGFLFIDATSA